LRSAGFEATVVGLGGSALELMRSDPAWDLVLLDLGLPDMDGQQVCATMRAMSDVPVIIVSARGEEVDKVIGLELGADDYLAKPFGTRELLARVRAVLRRSRQSQFPAVRDSRAVGDLVIDRRTRRVYVAGVEVGLTAKEFDLLSCLATDPGAVFTRGDLISRVWDVNWYGTTKTLDAHVATLRRKLGSPAWIEAVRGVGFRLVGLSGTASGPA